MSPENTTSYVGQGDSAQNATSYVGGDGRRRVVELYNELKKGCNELAEVPTGGPLRRYYAHHVFLFLIPSGSTERNRTRAGCATILRRSPTTRPPSIGRSGGKSCDGSVSRCRRVGRTATPPSAGKWKAGALRNSAKSFSFQGCGLRLQGGRV